MSEVKGIGSFGSTALLVSSMTVSKNTISCKNTDNNLIGARSVYYSTTISTSKSMMLLST